MKIKEKLAALYATMNNKFHEQFGFKLKNITFSKIVDYLHAPKDSSSLAVTRILFGLCMLFDIPDERQGAIMQNTWGPRICHFPLFPFIQPLAMPYMAIVYAGLWLGAMGIMLGYKYRYSAATFTVCYWYLFLVEKSHWNNHSYLFGLVALLLTCTDANCYWSIDAYLDPAKSKQEVPYWNYFILKYQFFILYFMAGLKKGTAEWLAGYSMRDLSEHWVFEPFKLFLTVPQIDYIVVHWFVFMFDLTVALWMMSAATRHVAMVFCAMFHLMNSRLFRIGMFPWVCLATMPLFYPFDWPKKLGRKLHKTKSCLCRKVSELTNKELHSQIQDDIFEDIVDEVNDSLMEDKEYCDKQCEVVEEIFQDQDPDKHNYDINKYNEKEVLKAAETNSDGKRENEEQTVGYDKKKITVYFIIFHVLSQAFLPYSHFITQGYNNWTNGLYGYSWDMMVHKWSTYSVVIQIVDNDKQRVFYIDPYKYAPNERWTKHGDMVHQYAKCIKDNLIKDAERYKANSERAISDNISIYVDVWCSLNGRFAQRMFDPKVDILSAKWSPFEKVPFLMPLLDVALGWREDLAIMEKDVHSWNNHSDVIFYADFPEYEQEKYISEDLQNVTLTILDGDVVYQPEVTKFLNGNSVLLSSGDRVSVESGLFHSVRNIRKTPVFYMYTFYNSTEAEKVKITPKLPLSSEVVIELYNRFYKMFKFGYVLIQSFSTMVFGCLKCH